MNDVKNIGQLMEIVGINKMPRQNCLILIQALTQRCIDLENKQ